MHRVSELSGVSYLTEVTALLQRARVEHPTKGLWEAADRHWWWRAPRSTDNRPMPFWYDDEGPVAAAVVNEWSSSIWLDLLTVPSVTDSLIREVLDSGLEMTADDVRIEMLVDDKDQFLMGLLTEAGFDRQSGDGDATAWMNAGTLPKVSALSGGYSLHNRADNASTPYHYARRNGPEAEDRLRQTSLYRADLDLFVVDDQGEVVAYGLFWHDPATGVGLVEPMRTEQPHQGKGLGRHILTTGIHKLVAAGSERIKISYETVNEPAVTLYLDAGFEPAMTCSLWSATRNASSHRPQ